jgi:hypothetical protein
MKLDDLAAMLFIGALRVCSIGCLAVAGAQCLRVTDDKFADPCPPCCALKPDHDPCPPCCGLSRENDRWLDSWLKHEPARKHVGADEFGVLCPSVRVGVLECTVEYDGSPLTYWTDSAIAE